MTSSTTITIDLDTLPLIVADDEPMKVSTHQALCIIADAVRVEVDRRGLDCDVVVDMTSGRVGATTEPLAGEICDRVLCDGADDLRAIILA